MIINCANEECQSSEIVFGKPNLTGRDFYEGNDVVHQQRIGIITWCQKCGREDELIVTSETDRDSMVNFRSSKLALVGGHSTVSVPA